MHTSSNNENKGIDKTSNHNWFTWIMGLCCIISIEIFFIQIFVLGRINDPLGFLPQPLLFLAICIFARYHSYHEISEEQSPKRNKNRELILFGLFSLSLSLFFFAGFYSNTSNYGWAFQNHALIASILMLISVLLPIVVVILAVLFRVADFSIMSQIKKARCTEKSEILCVILISIITGVVFFIPSTGTVLPSSDATIILGIISLYFLFFGHFLCFFRGQARSPYGFKTNLFFWGVLVVWVIFHGIMILITGEPFLCRNYRGICNLYPSPDELIARLILAPVFEELLFTLLLASMIRNLAKNQVQSIFFLVNISILFAMAHYNQYIDPRINWFVPVIALQKICEVLIYLTSNNAALPMFFHGLFNFCSLLLGPLPATIIYFILVIIFFIGNWIAGHSFFRPRDPSTIILFPPGVPSATTRL